MTIERGKRWELRLGDWRESPVQQCDHVITDPPYTEHVHGNQRRSGASNGPGAFQVLHTDDLSFAALNELEAAVRTALMAARQWCMFWCAVEQFGEYLDAGGGWRSEGGCYIRSGIWVKSNPTPQMTGDRPGQWGEGCAILHRPGGRMKWNGGGHSARWEGPSERGEERFHETQKPLWLITRQVELFTEPDDLVWDMYAGSATTGVACINTGRNFVGHELDEEYFWKAVSRLRAAEQGLSRADYERGQTSLLGLNNEE